MKRSAIFTQQRRRMLALLGIAYKLSELGYGEESQPIFRLAAKEGAAALKHAVSRNIPILEFDTTAAACIQAWRKAGPNVAGELQEFETWLTVHTP